jgi:hypothetical protein
MCVSLCVCVRVLCMVVAAPAVQYNSVVQRTLVRFHWGLAVVWAGSQSCQTCLPLFCDFQKEKGMRPPCTACMSAVPSSPRLLSVET